MKIRLPCLPAGRQLIISLIISLCSVGILTYTPAMSFAEALLGSTKVQMALKKERDSVGRVIELIFSDDTTQTTAAGGGINNIVEDTTPQLGGTLDAQDNIIQKAEIKDYSETLTTVSNSGATETLNLENGNAFDITLDNNCTFTFSNPPASGKMGSFTLLLRQDATGSRTTTWPASVDWAGGTAPTLTTTASALDILTFLTVDGGTIWHGIQSEIK